MNFGFPDCGKKSVYGIKHKNTKPAIAIEYREEQYNKEFKQL